MGELFAPAHVITLVIVALLLFGPAKLPALGRASGQMLREFKLGLREGMQPTEAQQEHSETTESKPDMRSEV